MHARAKFRHQDTFEEYLFNEHLSAHLLDGKLGN